MENVTGEMESMPVDTSCVSHEVSVFSVILNDENTSLLTDLCFEREYFFVVDNENKRIKRFQRQDNQLKDYIFLEDPCGVCKLLLSSHIVVTEPCHRQLTYVSVEGNMILSSRRKTKKKYGAIRCLDETRLVVGCCELSNATVDILDYTGKVLNSINRDDKDVSLFLTPACLTCYNEKFIIVSDSGTRNVTCVNKNGKLEWVIELQTSPSGVCVSKSGTIFICLYNENKILSIDNVHDGSITGSIGDISFKHPLTISHSSGCLYVTEEMPSDRIVQIQVDEQCDRPKAVALSNIHITLKKESDQETTEELSSDED